VSPRRGLKNTGDIWAFGRMPRLTASIKPLMQLLIFFSTPNDKKKYTDLLFIEENMTIDGLPEEIKNMLDENLLHK